jgi:hypothetical protein
LWQFEQLLRYIFTYYSSIQYLLILWWTDKFSCSSVLPILCIYNPNYLFYKHYIHVNISFFGVTFSIKIDITCFVRCTWSNSGISGTTWCRIWSWSLTRCLPNVVSVSVLCFCFVCLCHVSSLPNVVSVSVLCFCFVCLCHVSCLPNVVTVSVLCFCFVCLRPVSCLPNVFSVWIVNSWLPLQFSQSLFNATL